MPRIAPERQRSQMFSCRLTPQSGRYIKQLATDLGESLSDFVRESLRLRAQIETTYGKVAADLGHPDASTLVWHAVEEYAANHRKGRGNVTMPAKPEPEGD